MIRADHAEMLRRALPPGECWPHDGSTPNWDALLLALCGESERLDADALALVDDFIPDGSTSTAFLADWERVLALSPSGLTTAQRWQAIRAKLQGNSDPTRANLEAILETVRGDLGLLLFHHVQPPAVVGVCDAGDPCGDAYAAAWICEYMPLVLTGAAPDNFAGTWTAGGGNTITAAAFGSPISGATTASQIHLINGGAIYNTMTEAGGAADGDLIYSSFWARTVSGTATIDVLYLKRDGTDSARHSVTLTTEWTQIEYQALIGTGATVPRMRIENTLNAAAEDWYVADAVAGPRDLAFEAQAARIFPINTQGIWHVQGENYVSS